LATKRENRTGDSRGARRNPARRRDNEGMIPVLAKAVREVDIAIERHQMTSRHRARYQASALLARQERARIQADDTITEAQRDNMMRRLDGVATNLARTAAREPSLFSLLQDDAEITDATRQLQREMQVDAGLEPAPEEVASPDATIDVRQERKARPQSVVAAQLANPFLTPDFSQARAKPQGRLVGWELIGPVLNAFEHPAPGASACMELPDPRPLMGVPGSLDLMAHQSKVLSAVADGHRTFLLADEPGLGKTAQALLAAQIANAYPLLAVVPNVVKTNWAREAELWTPGRSVSVIHGDGDTIDGFADIVVVNYEVLDRHVDWIGDHGFRGMVVDEAHYIKNKKSQRSQHVIEVSERIRRRAARPLLMALTGTPLINDIDDFRAIWQFLGWIEERKPGNDLMAALEETGLTPADHAFYPDARQAVIDLGIVRRRKVDVAADIPARRVADLPVELEGAVGRSIAEAERQLAQRLVGRYQAALEHRRTGSDTASMEGGIDHELVRRVAEREVAEGSGENTSGDNVFTMVRKIGQAKTELAADYAAQLARSAGKVVFFAKHLDVMDAAAALFAKRDIRYTSIRGNQTTKVRQAEIDAFVNDPDVKIIVCSLTAAGVGINLQVASNVVLAELSWTNAGQTQAIDRVHRIGQTEPVTAWRIIAAQTIDAKIAELIDQKAGLAARALDGADEDLETVDVQVETLVALLTEALASESA